MKISKYRLVLSRFVQFKNYIGQPGRLLDVCVESEHLVECEKYGK